MWPRKWGWNSLSFKQAYSLPRLCYGRVSWTSGIVCENDKLVLQILGKLCTHAFHTVKGCTKHPGQWQYRNRSTVSAPLNTSYLLHHHSLPEGWSSYRTRMMACQRVARRACYQWYGQRPLQGPESHPEVHTPWTHTRCIWCSCKVGWHKKESSKRKMRVGLSGRRCQYSWRCRVQDESKRESQAINGWARQSKPLERKSSRARGIEGERRARTRWHFGGHST